MSEKIRAQHLERKAILYVRQSSQYQVIHNLESQKLQYAMKHGYGSWGNRPGAPCGFHHALHSLPTHRRKVRVDEPRR